MGLILRQPDVLADVQASAQRAEQAALAVAGRARAPLENWHNVGDPGEPSFPAGIANYGAGYNPLAFFRDPDGFIHLRGMITGSALGSMTTLFTLPDGYRPPNTERQLALGQITTGATPSYVVAPLEIWVTGEVRGGAGVSDWLTLDNHDFRNQ